MVGFGNRLRELRGSTKQTDAAKELGINYSTYAMYEVDRREPNFETLVSIAKHYGVTTDYLLGVSDCKSPDIEKRAICAKTGLSAEVVDNLVEMNSDKNEIFVLKGNEDFNDAFLSDWGQRKAGVYQLINNLLTFPLLEDVIFLDEEISAYAESKRLYVYAFDEEKKAMYNKFTETIPDEMRPLVVHPMEIEELYEYNIEKRLRVIADHAYRLKKHGTIFAKGRHYKNVDEFEKAIYEERNKNGEA